MVLILTAWGSLMGVFPRSHKALSALNRPFRRAVPLMRLGLLVWKTRGSLHM